MNYSDCATHRTDMHISVSEKGRTFKLYNPSRRNVAEVKVDGCLMPSSMERCDYLFEITVPSLQVHYVELKGKNVMKAISQIRSTIEYSKDRYADHKKTCYVICSRVAPAMRTDIQSENAKLRKDYQAKLLVKAREYQLDIT